MSALLKLSVASVLLVFIVVYLHWIKSLYANSAVLFDMSSKFEREYTIGNPADPSIMLVALGDSITQGSGLQKVEDTYVYRLAEVLSKEKQYVKVVNIAKSGAKTKDLVDRQLPLLKSYEPDYIVLTIGTNDATHFIPLDTYKNNLTAITDELGRYPKAKIILANSIDAGKFPSLPPIYNTLVSRRAARQNQVLADILVSKNSNISIVDLYGRGKLDAKTNPDYYASDLFHPAKAGYDKWLDLFVERL